MTSLYQLYLLFIKTLRDQRRILLYGWAGMTLMASLVMLLYPALRNLPAPEKLTNNISPALASVLFAGQDFQSPANYLNLSLLSFLAPITLSGLAIYLGSEILAREEAHGRLDLLLSLPISRSRLMLIRMAALLLLLFLMALGLWLGLLPGSQLTGLALHSGQLLGAAMNLLLLALTFGTLALAVSSITGIPEAGRNSAWGGYLLAWAIQIGVPVIHAPVALSWLSPLYHYSSSDPLGQGLSPLHITVLAGLSLAAMLAALIGFNRRDLRTTTPR
jgi:ABC-2 type transport system permease protein